VIVVAGSIFRLNRNISNASESYDLQYDYMIGAFHEKY